MGVLNKIEQTRRRFVKEEFALLILLLIMVSLFFSRPEVIGYASTNIHSQPLSLVINQSKSYYLESYVPVHLTSMAISGKIEGKGTASVYLDNERGSRLLVFKNIKKASSKINQITGSAPSNSVVLPFSGTGVSGLSVTGSALPAKQSPPTLMIFEGNLIPDIEPLPSGYLAISGVFNHACVESCILQASEFTGDRFKLDFFIEPGTTLEVNELIYTTYEADE